MPTLNKSDQCQLFKECSTTSKRIIQWQHFKKSSQTFSIARHHLGNVDVLCEPDVLEDGAKGPAHDEGVGVKVDEARGLVADQGHLGLPDVPEEAPGCRVVRLSL